jgi:hypothetical protein
LVSPLKNNSQRTFFCQSEEVCHLSRRDNAGLVEDDDTATHAIANARVLQEAFDGDDVGEAHLLQLLDGTHRGSNCKYFMAGVHKPPPQFFQSCGLTRAGGATDAYD